MKHKFYKFLVSLVSMENSMKVKNKSKEKKEIGNIDENNAELNNALFLAIKDLENNKFKILI